MRSYIDVAKELPVPTEAQTREFAEYVTGAHSWYKHLAAHAYAPFYFFLDPNAGRSMVHVSEGEVTFVDRTDASEKFHYTWQTTESYRRRFGFWNYDAAYGRSFQFSGEGGMVDTAGAGQRILAPDEAWLEVPENLTEAGTALVSSLIYSPSWRADASDLARRESEARNSFAFLSPRDGLRSDLEYIEKLIGTLPGNIAEPLRALRSLWMDEGFQREKADAHRAQNEMYRKAFASDLPFDEVIDPETSSAMHAETKEAWEKTASRRKERVLMEPMLSAIDRERERQVAGMRAAMNRFVEMLHPKRSH